MQRVDVRASVTDLLGWSSCWAVEPSGASTVVLSAGADRRVEIDGLTPPAVTALRGWAAGCAIEPSDDEQRLLVDRLVELGAVAVTAVGGQRVAIRWLGAEDPALVAALDGAGLDVVPRGDGTALLLVVRTDDRPVPGLDDAHLGVDLTLHHTVLLGPFVVPGVTACLGCLRQRTVHRWGAPTIAARPAIRQWPAVVAQLVAVQVGLAAAGRSPLVNATIAWDLEQGTTDRQSLYKLTGCPACDTARPTGRIGRPA